MNDKQQLAAMGEHMAELAEQEQPMCMAKRIEELEAQVRGLKSANLSWQEENEGLGAKCASALDLLREATEWMEDHPAMPDSSRMRAALSGKLPEPAAPEGWKLVPVEPTHDMLYVIVNCGHFDVVQPEMAAKYYRAMLAAAPNPDSSK